MLWRGCITTATTTKLLQLLTNVFLHSCRDWCCSSYCLLLLLLCSKSLRGSTQTIFVSTSSKTALKVCYLTEISSRQKKTMLFEASSAKFAPTGAQTLPCLENSGKLTNYSNNKQTKKHAERFRVLKYAFQSLFPSALKPFCPSLQDIIMPLIQTNDKVFLQDLCHIY